MVAKWKRCTKCGQLKSVDDFPTRDDRPSGVSSWCKDCVTKAHLDHDRKMRALQLEKRLRHRTHEELIDEGERRTAIRRACNGDRD